jgi:N-acetylmuramoyl-L-alanine amidase
MKSHGCEVRGHVSGYANLLSSQQVSAANGAVGRPSGTLVSGLRLTSAKVLGFDLLPLRSWFMLAASVVLVVVAICGTMSAEPSRSSSSKKQQALAYYGKAEKMREALNGRPEKDRTRKDYLKVAAAYRKVYYTSPASSKADESILAVAEILAEMGHQFPPGSKDLHAAIGQYEFLRREYPGSKYRVEALFTIGQIYKEDLNDEAEAKKTFQEFLKKYPSSALSEKAHDALAELNQPKVKKKTEVAGKTENPPDEAVGKETGAARVTGIRYWSTADYTRVAIDLDADVKYEAGRVPDPDRIFFDLSDTRLVSTLVGKSFDVQDGFLKKIRVGQYDKDSTRIVLDVDDVTEYSAFLLPNPYRLIVDIHGKTTATGKVATGEPPEAKKDAAATTDAALKPNAKTTLTANAGSAAKTSEKPEQKAGTSAASPIRAESAPTTTAFKTAGGELKPEAKSESKSSATAAGAATNGEKAKADSANIMVPKATPPPATRPSDAPTAVTVVPEKKSGRSKKSAKNNTGGIQPVHVAEPTSEGDRSLIRALGLKIGTIVIDAGHGGHDTGTIGPKGLLEKDLVLDVALRLGKLLESRLGANVIYTRDDDTFIPLETRTAIANEHRADMFISVHANSSSSSSARGVETYYLNFTTNADALEVAARENAVSEKSVYELQDLVKKITLKDKIEESRELAGDVQQSLYAGLSPKNPTLRNRGVKKAPFVVLIGANMPSILAEISFVSNPTDEKKLQTPEYRQKIAESLYKGIAKYADGLSGVKVASKLEKESGK